MRALTFFLLIFFCSCDNNPVHLNTSQQILVIDLVPKPVTRLKRLSEFAVNIEYIPLETTKYSLIGPFILKIVNRGTRIYLQNSGLEGEILCFEMNGRFLFKINNKGRGPEEYTAATDFDVSSENKTLAILSSSSHKLVRYGISDTGFTFQNSISLKDPAPYKLCMVPETGNLFLAIPPWRGNEPSLSLLINTDGDTIHYKPNCYKFTMARKTNYRASNEMIVYSIGTIACFKEEFSDTIFYIDAKNNLFKQWMIFETHGTLFTPEMRGNPELPFDHTSFISNIFETSRYVFYSYGSRETRKGDPPIVNVFLDKRTKKKYILDVEFIFETFVNNTIKTPVNKLKDDLNGGPDFTIRIDLWDRSCSGGKLFSFVDAITLKKYVNSEDFKNAEVIDPKKKYNLKRLADSLKETDNPVLVIVTPKE